MSNKVVKSWEFGTCALLPTFIFHNSNAQLENFIKKTAQFVYTFILYQLIRSKFGLIRPMFKFHRHLVELDRRFPYNVVLWCQ